MANSPIEHITSMRASCAELSHSKVDTMILGQLMASSEVSTAARHKEDECKEAYTSFSHQGKPICIRTFQFLRCVGSKRLKNLTKASRSIVWLHKFTVTPGGSQHINRVCGEVPAFICRAPCIAVARMNSRVQLNRHSTPAIKCVKANGVEGVP